MTAVPWHLGRMAALDFESSDKIPESARIVTCSWPLKARVAAEAVA